MFSCTHDSADRIFIARLHPTTEAMEGTSPCERPCPGRRRGRRRQCLAVANAFAVAAGVILVVAALTLAPQGAEAFQTLRMPRGIGRRTARGGSGIGWCQGTQTLRCVIGCVLMGNDHHRFPPRPRSGLHLFLTDEHNIRPRPQTGAPAEGGGRRRGRGRARCRGGGQERGADVQAALARGAAGGADGACVDESG